MCVALHWIQCVFLLHVQYSWDEHQLHLDLNQDKVITEIYHILRQMERKHKQMNMNRNETTKGKALNLSVT